MHNFSGRFNDCFSGFGGSSIGGYIMMGIGVILIIVLIYFVLKKGVLTNNTNMESPLDLLKKRFVDGDIDEKEYLNKKSVLESK